MISDTAPMAPTHDVRARPGATPGRGRIGELGVDAPYVLTSFPIALVGFVLVVIRSPAQGRPTRGPHPARA